MGSAFVRTPVHPGCRRARDLFGEPLAGAEGTAGEGLAAGAAMDEFKTFSDATEDHRVLAVPPARTVLDERGTIYLSPTLSVTSVPSVANFC